MSSFKAGMVGMILGYPGLYTDSYGLIVSQDVWERFVSPALGQPSQQLPPDHLPVRVLGTRIADSGEAVEAPVWEPNRSLIRHWISTGHFRPYKVDELVLLIERLKRRSSGSEHSYLEEVIFELRIIQDVRKGQKIAKGADYIRRYYDFFTEIMRDAETEEE